MSPAPAPLSRLLTEQGDSRLVRDPASGRNRYGCGPVPGGPDFGFGSATASTISPEAFASARDLHAKVTGAAPSAIAAEFDRLRAELAGFCGVDGLTGTGIVFAASGTDLHLLAAQRQGRSQDGGRPGPLIVVLSEASETGNGVPAALQGRHHDGRAPFRDAVLEGGVLEGCRGAELAMISARDAGGRLRAKAETDAETERKVSQAAEAGHDVLLIVSDQSKTGLLTPSPALALALSRRFKGRVEVLVDACQMRLAPETLRAYVEHGFLVALTGSKFATGPAFSGALLVPADHATAWCRKPLPPSFADYSSRMDWPKGWVGRESMNPEPNLGLLFRWQAALCEMRAFNQLSRSALTAFFGAFASALHDRLSADPTFEAVDCGGLDRSDIATAQTWDREATVFPFWVKRGGVPLALDETKILYKKILEHGGQIGQPAQCGKNGNRPLGALRLSNSMRLAVAALKPGGKGQDAVIASALGLLDLTAKLVKEL